MCIILPCFRTPIRPPHLRQLPILRAKSIIAPSTTLRAILRPPPIALQRPRAPGRNAQRRVPGTEERRERAGVLRGI